MPYTSTIVDDGKGIHKTGSGIVTGLEIFSSALRDTLDETNARQLCYGLIDFSDITEMQVTPDDIHRIVEMNRKMAEFTPRAFVAIVAPAQLPYALSRLWQTTSTDLTWKSNVFHTRPDAIAWLRKQLISPDAPPASPDPFPSLTRES